MIAAAVPLCSHIHPTCTNNPTITNYRCRLGASTPDLVVVAAERGIAGAGPGAAWLPVAPDDYVATHLSTSSGPLHPHQGT